MTQPLTESDPGPVPPDALIDSPATVRARRIAAIHALAQFYADNPDVPMPTTVVGAQYVFPQNLLEEGDEIARAVDLATRHAGSATEDHTTVKCRIPVASQDGMTVSICHTVYLAKPQTRRLV